MKKRKIPLPVILRSALCILLGIWAVMAAPTGWLYDLRAGSGTEQGQWPVESVRQIKGEEDVEALFQAAAPATVAAGALTACPLARLRDVGQEGVHYKSGPGRRSVYVAEYITADNPFSPWEKTLQSLLCGGFYNRYHLVELEDGSSLCVYFDDYLTLTETGRLPTGYIRYTTAQERRMLDRMAQDYDVDPVYVLDMYRHGKVNWMLDLTLRLGVVLAVGLAVAALRDLWRKRKHERAPSQDG